MRVLLGCIRTYLTENKTYSAWAVRGFGTRHCCLLHLRGRVSSLLATNFLFKLFVFKRVYVHVPICRPAITTSLEYWHNHTYSNVATATLQAECISTIEIMFSKGSLFWFMLYTDARIRQLPF